MSGRKDVRDEHQPAGDPGLGSGGSGRAGRRPDHARRYRAGRSVPATRKAGGPGEQVDLGGDRPAGEHPWRDRLPRGWPQAGGHRRERPDGIAAGSHPEHRRYPVWAARRHRPEMIQAIKTTGLTKTYGEKRALDDVNLVVPEGSIFGFLGPNGAGKTTTLRILTGLARPTSGSVQILSHDVAMAGNEVRADVGFLPDVPGFYEWMTAEGLLRFAGRLFLCSPSRCREPPSSSPRQRSTRCSSRSWSSL